VGRKHRLLGILALSSVSQWAHANPSEQQAPPAAEAMQPQPGPAAEATPPQPAAAVVVATTPPPPRPAVQSASPHVIWVAPGDVRARHSSTTVDNPAAPARPFSVGSTRFMVGLERASSVAGYSSSTTFRDEPEVVTSGVEASIVGQVEQEAYTPLVMPRLSLDARLANGLSIGLAFGYAARSARRHVEGMDPVLPSSESVLIAPRVGWLKPLSSNVGLWLKGGPTWAMRAGSEPSSEPGSRRTVEQRQWALSLEPQLVFMPLRHVGLSVGGAFDLGFDGENKVTYRSGHEQTTSRLDETVSTYGITLGLLALF
jgi:hypothetical protein